MSNKIINNLGSKPELNQVSWLCSYLKKMPALNNFDFSNLFTVLNNITLPQYDRFKNLISNNKIISIKNMLYSLGLKQYGEN